MSANDNVRYYWLKLNKDFFQKHQIRVIEGMKNGKEYVLFYLKIMVEATAWEGELRFSPTIPYDENMLATLTNTPVDTVHTAMEIFRKLGLVDIWDDGTLYIEEVKRITGSETGKAIRDREYRQRLQGKAHEGLTAGSEQAQTSQEIRVKRLESRRETTDYTNVPSSVSHKFQPVTTSIKQSALCEILLDWEFVTHSELEDPQWEDLMDWLFNACGGNLVDAKLRLQYVLRGVCHLTRDGEDDQGLPYFRRAYDAKIGNRYLWLKSALERAQDAWGGDGDDY